MVSRFALRSRAAVALLAASLGLQGCVAGGGLGGRSSAMDRAIGQCFAGVALSAGLGAILGAQGGSRDGAGRGALIGAGVGLGACAVFLEVAAAEDRAAIRLAQVRALDAGESRTETFRAQSGKAVAVRTEVARAPVPPKRAAGKPAPRPISAPRPAPAAAAEPAEPKADASAFTDCRYSSQTVSVEGQAASASKEMWCRKGGGDWEQVSV